MLALRIREEYDKEPSLITVAGPRLGNGGFAEHYRAVMPSTPAFHLVHDRDEVITSNVELWDGLGFEHGTCHTLCVCVCVCVCVCISLSLSLSRSLPLSLQPSLTLAPFHSLPFSFARVSSG